MLEKMYKLVLNSTLTSTLGLHYQGWTMPAVLTTSRSISFLHAVLLAATHSAEVVAVAFASAVGELLAFVLVFVVVEAFDGLFAGSWSDFHEAVLRPVAFFFLRQGHHAWQDLGLNWGRRLDGYDRIHWVDLWGQDLDLWVDLDLLAGLLALLLGVEVVLVAAAAAVGKFLTLFRLLVVEELLDRLPALSYFLGLHTKRGDLGDFRSHSGLDGLRHGLRQFVDCGLNGDLRHGVHSQDRHDLVLLAGQAALLLGIEVVLIAATAAVDEFLALAGLRVEKELLQGLFTLAWVLGPQAKLGHDLLLSNVLVLLVLVLVLFTSTSGAAILPGEEVVSVSLAAAKNELPTSAFLGVEVESLNGLLARPWVGGFAAQSLFLFWF